jgi:hypothetical protein
MTDHSTQFESLPGLQYQNASPSTDGSGFVSQVSVDCQHCVEESQMLLVEEKTVKNSFGGKSITFMGSIVLLVNNIMGPAMVTIPLVYHLGTLRCALLRDIFVAVKYCSLLYISILFIFSSASFVS